MITQQQVLNAFRPAILRLVELASPAIVPGTVITSWYRDAYTNRRVGGSDASQHRVATAVDLVPPSHAWQQTERWLQDNGLVVVNEGDHLHVQLFQAGALERAGVRFDLLP